ncbi:hypothetical protein FOG18_12280 [Legionella israelensis]|uniref:beta-ketoacyl synthase N-terminal-like domain-containing protein n=1 Tax=Legionella israelensis TaxID=454 RepID=UPI00117C1110|nr:beta-ketoacyl synthase N-terminal-like domain-containing protein [Legionella israelensis]QDP73284.1 hypothetical protein FOG18_12280 [Legionella israelensis]
MHKDDQGIAIIGFHMRLPACQTPLDLMNNLDNQYSAIRNQLTNPLQNQIAYMAEIDDVDCFDASFFHYTKQEASMICPQQRLLLESSWLALDNANIKTPLIENNKTGVFTSCSANPFYWQALLTEYSDPINQYQILINNDKDYSATRIAYKFNCQGPAMSIQTGCSSGLVALHQAKRAIENNECDTAIVGAASVTFPIVKPMPLVEGMIFSQTGQCHPYCHDANGTVGGMGVVVLIVSSLRLAIENAQPILAVIKGSALNNDGHRKMSYTAPSVDAQIGVMREALDNADIKANEIDFIEGHGTATKIGDAIELTALEQVYGDGRSIPLGSIKANIGHLDVASGLASTLKAALALNRKATFPQPYAELTMPNLKPHFQLYSQPQPLNNNSYAAVSALGVGGTNAHIILGPAPVDSIDGSLLIHKKPTYRFNKTHIPIPGMPDNEPNYNAETLTNNSVVNPDVKSKVLEAWNKVLGQHNWQSTDNFFEVGGESLTAIALAQQINLLTGLKLTYTAIFDCPTLGQLTESVMQEVAKPQSNEVYLSNFEQTDDYEFEEL